MTRKEKVNVLEWYCDHCGDTYDKSELKNMYDKKKDEFTNNYSCAFDEMDDKMLDKIYSWYKELDPAAGENAEAECCNAEPDDLKLHIEPKVARHYAICQKLNQIYKAKNHDYGDSFGDTYKKLGIISAVTRLSDKLHRLMSLAVSPDAQVKAANIAHTCLALATYAIMTLIELGYEPENQAWY